MARSEVSYRNLTRRAIASRDLSICLSALSMMSEDDPCALELATLVAALEAQLLGLQAIATQMELQVQLDADVMAAQTAYDNCLNQTGCDPGDPPAP